MGFDESDKVELHHEAYGKLLLRFCETCSSVIKAPLFPITFNNLQASSVDCRTCAFLLKAIERCTRDDERKINGTLQFDSRGSTHGFQEGHMPLRLIWITSKRGTGIFVPIELDFAKRDDLSSEDDRVGCSQKSIEIAQAWLQDCVLHSSSKHAQCRYFSPAYVPTRLLELEAMQHGLSVRLRELDLDFSIIDKASNKYRYVALSHCWGPPGSPRFTTTHETLEARKTGIPWSEIPCTFQDAMVFTHRLGVRYIWIDSLCIIQGDAKDWLIEAEQMAQIYHCSYFTIAAANAPDSGAGLFQLIPREMRARPSVPLSDANGNDEYILHAKRISNYSVDDLDRYPYMSRGWTYQERSLSPRVIYFLHGELGWSCENFTDDEQHSRTLYVFADARARHAISINPVIYRKKWKSLEEIICHWQRIVGEYSGLALTLEKDKLPALSGMAKAIGMERQGSYFAGIWSNSLIVDLTWRCCKGPGRRPTMQRAPSWSWASIDGEVDFWAFLERHEVKEVAKCIHVSCDHPLEWNAEFMEVRGGLLEISGPVVQSIPDGEFFADDASMEEPIDRVSVFYFQLCHTRDKLRETELGENIYMVLRQDNQVASLFKRVGLARSPGELEFDPGTIQTIRIT